MGYAGRDSRSEQARACEKGLNVMKKSNQQGQQPVQPPGGQAYPGGPPQYPPVPPYPANAPGPQQPEKDPGNVTMFRTTNFFVHVVTPLLKTGSLQRAGGNATILERVRWVSIEKQRLMAAQTRLLPQVDTATSSLRHEIAIPGWLESLAVALVLAVTLILQGLNIFNYPAYSPDEGTYMANAWAILHGMLTPYTYTYSHPPIGWLQLAAWAQLTGGLASFGSAINSGRVFMLALAAGSSALLYLITSRLSGSRSAALLAMVIYTLSPLSLIYRREVLIDNIATFWLLVSLCLITTGKSKMRTFALAAIALGLALLSLETFVLFVPAMLYAVWLYATPFQRKFSLLTFIYIALAITSAYILLAVLKGELLPPGVLSANKGSHPSLIGTLLQELQAPPVSGQFRTTWNTWMQTDPVIFVAGTIAMFINVLGGTVNRFQLLAAFFLGSMWAFLLVSSTVYPTAIISMLPFLAINIALALNTPLRWLTRKAGFDLVRALLLFALIGLLIPAGIQRALPLVSPNAAQPQQQAMLWVRNNVPRNAVIITSSYMFADLRQSGSIAAGSGQPFAHAQIYSETVLDPTVFYKELKGNWQQINFLVVDATMMQQIKGERQYELLNQALHHAIRRASFGSSKDGTQIQIYQVIST